MLDSAEERRRTLHQRPRPRQVGQHVRGHCRTGERGEKPASPAHRRHAGETRRGRPPLESQRHSRRRAPNQRLDAGTRLPHAFV